MTGGLFVRITNHYRNRIDWKLLVFLLLFLNVKLVVKLAAIIIIYFIQKDFKFGLRMKNSRLPLFYLCVSAIAILNWIINKGFTSTNYSFVVLTGLCFWMACMLIVHQLKIFVEKNDSAIIYQTLIAFFIVNAFASFAELVKIIIETGAINPYRYQGNYQKYFISTGDYIKGISFDTSTTNAILNAFGLILFLYKKNARMVLLCMTVLLFTASNLTNIFLLIVLTSLFILKTNRDQKSLIAICFFLLIVFMGKISPQNNEYIADAYAKLVEGKTITASPKKEKEIPLQQRPDSMLNDEEKKQKIALLYLDSISLASLKNRGLTSIAGKLNSLSVRPELPKENIHSIPFQHRDDTNEIRNELLAIVKKDEIAKYPEHRAGKLQAFYQTFDFFLQHPAKIISGTGTGNFSSKLAFRATALHFAGGYPQRLQYINPDFEKNHLDLYSYFFSRPARMRSVINSPNSFYDQLISEYGLIGCIAFAIFYLGHFLKEYKFLSYGLPMLFLLLCFLLTDYWFEQLSVIPFFELLIFLNMKEIKSVHAK